MKMWLLFLIGLVSWKGSLAVSNFCLVQASNVCLASRLYESSFPENKEELDAVCSDLRDKKACIDRHSRICDDDESYDRDAYHREVDKMKNILGLIHLSSDICQEDSPLQEKFLENASCFKAVIEGNTTEGNCQSYAQTAKDHLLTRTERRRLALRDQYLVFEDQTDFQRCLKVTFNLNCYVFKINKVCGSAAKDTAIKIIRGSKYLFQECEVTDRLDVIELANDFKLITNQDIYAREFLLSDFIS